MNACLSDFRVVNPTLRTFSAAEARIAQSSIRFNNLSAAELGYPENVRLLISSEGTTLAIQACDKDDPCAVPFMSGRTAEDLKGQKVPRARLSGGTFSRKEALCANGHLHLIG